jgi:hypothetical protein
MAAFSVLLAFVHGTLGMMVGGVFGARLIDNVKREVVGDVKSIQGSKIFKDYCIICHPKGGNIINPMKPLLGSNRLKDFDTFLDYIRNPEKYEGPQSPMPAFSRTQISDEAAKELYLHIISMQGSDKPPFSTILSTDSLIPVSMEFFRSEEVLPPPRVAEAIVLN